MSLLVTGSIGIDTVETPFGKRQDVIGGSAIYFSYAASFFAPVRLVGVVGQDWPASYLDVFKDRDVDTVGLEVRKGSKTFRWHGSYLENLNEAVTVVVTGVPELLTSRLIVPDVLSCQAVTKYHVPVVQVVVRVGQVQRLMSRLVRHLRPQWIR